MTRQQDDSESEFSNLLQYSRLLYYVVFILVTFYQFIVV